MEPTSAPATADELLAILLSSDVGAYITVPCTITSDLHALVHRKAGGGDLQMLTTIHEANLIGMAAGIWFASGRPAVIHLQNSGLGHLADSYISFASPEMFAIPMAAIITFRGATSEDASEPHQAIGRRTDALIRDIFSPGTVIQGDRLGRQDARVGLRAVLQAALAGGQGVLKLPAAALQAGGADAPLQTKAFASDSSRQPSSTPRSAETQRPLRFRERCSWNRDEAILAIMDEHPHAALLFSNGYTARAAQALADGERNFYNIGYMGGTLAIGWALARERPDLDVVVVDGDQNAEMSCMKDHLANDYPQNLYWYILNNRVGASVGGAVSLPLANHYAHLACIINTEANATASFNHPRVHPASHTPGGNLAELSARFRAWLAAQQPSAQHNCRLDGHTSV